MQHTSKTLPNSAIPVTKTTTVLSVIVAAVFGAAVAIGGSMAIAFGDAEDPENSERVLAPWFAAVIGGAIAIVAVVCVVTWLERRLVKSDRVVPLATLSGSLIAVSAWLVLALVGKFGAWSAVFVAALLALQVPVFLVALSGLVAQRSQLSQ